MVVALIAVLFVVSCNKAHYDDVDDRGYRVSIKYDASGGEFATSAGIMVDSYRIDNLPTNANGEKEIYLVDPKNEDKGEAKVVVENPGFAFTGWYEEREPVLNEQGQQLDVYGGIASETRKQPAYIYSKQWDFEKQTILIDSNKEYTSSEPVKTLYAGWIREFEFAFYDKATGLPIMDNAGTKEQVHKFNPLMETNQLNLPYWDMETGEIKMGEWPTKDGATFVSAYLENGEKITSDSVTHPGTYDPDTGIIENTSLKLYIEYKQGNWHKVSKPEQINNSSLCYELLNDIDFEGKTWAIANEEFTGKIVGNGYTIKNIVSKQSSSQYYGLFGSLGSKASLENVNFENVTISINVLGAEKNGSIALGAFAGEISADANIENVKLTNFKLQLSQDGSTMSNDISAGLLCGNGYKEEFAQMLSAVTIEILPPENSYYYYEITYVLDTNGNDLVNLTYTFVARTN